MQRIHWTMTGGVVAGLATILVYGAESAKLNVKTGLWAVAYQSQVTGSPQIPPEEAARLNPDQRARIEAAMQAAIANATKARSGKDCLTPEKLAQGLDLNGNKASSCQHKLIKNSSSELEMSETCTTAEGQSVSEEHIVANGSDQVSGTVSRVMSAGGNSWTVNTVIQGKWLGASCGSVKDFEIDK
jgi:uncharacterized protein DUF3617